MGQSSSASDALPEEQAKEEQDSDESGWGTEWERPATEQGCAKEEAADSDESAWGSDHKGGDAQEEGAASPRYEASGAQETPEDMPETEACDELLDWSMDAFSRAIAATNARAVAAKAVALGRLRASAQARLTAGDRPSRRAEARGPSPESRAKPSRKRSPGRRPKPKPSRQLSPESCPKPSQEFKAPPPVVLRSATVLGLRHLHTY